MFNQPAKKLNAGYDTNHFFYYQRGAEELVLFRKELPCSIEGKDYVLSAFVDITVIDKERKLEAAANSAKSDFLAKMSHEIRTPMNGIIGMAETLSKEKLTASQKEYINIIVRSADLLLKIIDDILDYSKIEAGKMQIEDVPYVLNDEVEAATDVFKTLAEEKGLDIEIDIKEDVPKKIIGDPFRLRQVLSNLISNAIKFTNSGKILITVDLEESYSGNITLHFCVADTGTGIPEDKLETIFNTFTQAEYSTARQYGGSGLGTTICKQLVTLMNGEIWAESPSGLSFSKKNPGSAFHFTIEVFSNEKIDKKIDFEDIDDLSKVKVLVITHTKGTNKRLFNYLEHNKLKVTTKTPSETIISELDKELSGKKPKYHLIIIIDEPAFDGRWLARKLYERGVLDKYRLIMLSSNHKPENYIQCKISGVDFYLVQPFDHKSLNSCISEFFPSVKFPESTSLDLRKDIEILVTEDNLINQKVAHSIFGNLGYTITIANDGVEAVEMINKKSFDIIFMDLQMPEKDGIEATVDIRALGYQMPIVAMTASASEATKNKSFKAGMNEYITKPVKTETVQAILEKWFT